MKLFTATFFTACLISARALMAQDASTVPIPDSNPNAQPTPSPLFPNGTPPPIVDKPAPGSAGGAGHPAAQNNPFARKNSTEESTENIADNIAYRKAKTKALRDDRIQLALADVAAAKTDQEKRAALKQYYTLLADRILKLDGSIKKLVAVRLKDSLNQLSQNRVRPWDYPQQASASH